MAESVSDVQALVAILPQSIQQELTLRGQLSGLNEVVMDLGYFPELRWNDGAERLTHLPAVSADDIQCVLNQVSRFNDDNRAGIERTLHRVSAIRNRMDDVVGLTCRVGRAIVGTIAPVQDLITGRQNVLFLGPPGCGKTTRLREAARVLSTDLSRRVIVVDTSNEIGGDGDIPHPGIGYARRMQVKAPDCQHHVMIEAVENHMPQVVIVDEIGTEDEALAARTIAERGVQLIATAHGYTLENLVKNPTLSDLIGGIQSVILGDDEAKLRGTQKTVLERRAAPTFDIIVEIRDSNSVAIYRDTKAAVDGLLRRERVIPELRVSRPIEVSGKLSLDEVRQVTVDMMQILDHVRSTGKPAEAEPGSSDVRAIQTQLAFDHGFNAVNVGDEVYKRVRVLPRSPE